MVRTVKLNHGLRVESTAEERAAMEEALANWKPEACPCEDRDESCHPAGPKREKSRNDETAGQ